MLSFIQLIHLDIFDLLNPTGLQLLTRLRMGLRYLNEHKFKYKFHDFRNPLYSCNLELETTPHYLPRCHLLQIERRTLLNDFNKIDEHIITYVTFHLVVWHSQSDRLYYCKVRQVLQVWQLLCQTCNTWHTL